MTDPILELTDTKAEQLLELIYIAVAEYTTEDISISEFAADVAMSMNKTTDRADELRQKIEQAVT